VKTRKDYSLKERPPIGPIVVVVVGLTLAAVAVALLLLAIAGVPLR